LCGFVFLLAIRGTSVEQGGNVKFGSRWQPFPLPCPARLSLARLIVRVHER